jgi:hypothetical protein
MSRKTVGIRLPTFAAPRLTPVDLHLIDSHGYRVTRKGKEQVIQVGEYYLAIIGGLPYFGDFSKQHYGLNFNDGWGNVGHQFDPPGTNASTWTALWYVDGHLLNYAMKQGSKRQRALRASWTRKRKARDEERAKSYGWKAGGAESAAEFLNEFFNDLP